MKKFVKSFVIGSIFVCCAACIGLGGYFGGMYLKFSHIPLDSAALSSSSTKIALFDTENRPINEENSTSGHYVKIPSLPKHTTDAFVSIEDKSFYKHGGINPKRMVKAAISNLKSMSFRQGASTISQQLIKNTHLSSEKTIERKIKEIALTRKLEKSMSKDEILETYLNIIYFGNNCYGIEEASNYYFSKPAKELSLAESAMLAGMIKSPSKYSPITHEENSLQRRNVVLGEMLKDKKISEEQHFSATSEPLNLSLCTESENRLNSYSEAAIDEAMSILHLPAKQIALGRYKIHTYQDKEVQQRLESALEEVDFEDNDFAGIVIDNASHGVLGYTGSSAYKILSAKRQPGSCIKPILCYAPAINEKIITPATQILDDEVKIGEYSPQNVGGKLHGYVSAKESLAHSINIPAVKVLSYVGIDKAKSYAEKMGLGFDEKDDSYALALGGMTYGTNLLNLASAYSTFANLGNYAPAKFVSYITTEDGKLLYHHEAEETSVLSEDSAYLTTNLLEEAAKNGTAKKLSRIKGQIASKTGTVGKKGSNKNLDAWNIAYTQSQVCGIWCGNLDNTPISIAGGNQPTEAAARYFENSKAEEFIVPSSIVERDIDLVELEENHRVALATELTPERFKCKEIFSKNNLPRESLNFTSLPEIETSTQVIDGKTYITFDAKRHMTYKIFNSKNKLLYDISDKIEKVSLPVEDEEITLQVGYQGSQLTSTKTIKLIKKEKPEEKQKKKWWQI